MGNRGGSRTSMRQWRCSGCEARDGCKCGVSRAAGCRRGDDGEAEDVGAAPAAWSGTTLGRESRGRSQH
ncbi:hypothetical protein E2562_028675 [Oryza meyeriana var. granulata]|uniref:Uncharacterized protein n=1 Tax=Oryza meyeriana var. granulata TaxID=110450 RepID=A0A6G1BP79_9ORYZ|nr:hypothetical protein E2562_028675 [Oryza meyeriana var. granulata]